MPPNQYMFGYNQYTPPSTNAVMHANTSPTFSNSYFPLSSSSTASDNSSTASSVSSSYSSNTSYSFQNPRLRYYMSKSFDAEDDLEFCPDIPESFEQGHSPTTKKFNPYTASIFLPTAIQELYAVGGAHSPTPPQPQSPRQLTPRIKKPLEIINPQTKMRVSSSTISK